ncbi:retrotransposon protein, putative, ty3-gypsy subclass [Tanacetum coccineum]
MQVNVQFLQQLQPEWSRFVTVVKQRQEIDTVSYHKLFDVLKQFQNEVRAVWESKDDDSCGARETVGSPVVQQNGIQCFNCKGFGHYARECRKPKRVKDYAYHKEKMMMCKSSEPRCPLQVELADWLEDTDEVIDEQDWKQHYRLHGQRIRTVSPENQFSWFSHWNRMISKVILIHQNICTNDNQLINAVNVLFKLQNLEENAVCAECGTCVFNSNHDACVSIYLNEVNARTKKPNVVPISASKPKRKANKSVVTPHKKTVASDTTIQKSKSYHKELYENINQEWKWWIAKRCPSSFTWTQKPSRTKKIWMPR